MNYLALETSTHQSSIALKQGDKIELRVGPSGRGQTQWLLPEIDDLLKSQGLKVADLDGLVFSEGPGSFTGLRAGVSVIQAFAFAHDLPVVSVNSLEAYACKAFEQYGANEFVVCVDAKMGEVFFAQYRVSDNEISCIEQSQILKPEDLLNKTREKVFAIGDGWALEPLNSLKFDNSDLEIFPTADVLLKLAQSSFDAGNTLSAEAVMPVYLRDKTAWKTVKEQAKS